MKRRINCIHYIHAGGQKWPVLHVFLCFQFNTKPPSLDIKSGFGLLVNCWGEAQSEAASRGRAVTPNDSSVSFERAAEERHSGQVHDTEAFSRTAGCITYRPHTELKCPVHPYSSLISVFKASA